MRRSAMTKPDGSAPDSGGMEPPQPTQEGTDATNAGDAPDPGGIKSPPPQRTQEGTGANKAGDPAPLEPKDQIPVGEGAVASPDPEGARGDPPVPVPPAQPASDTTISQLGTKGGQR